MAGRKPFKVDWKRVNDLAEAGCNGKQIASSMGCSVETLYKKTKIKFGILWGEYERQHADKGIVDLRLAQHKKAIKGNTLLLIWLGKQRLDQYDRTAVNVSQADVDLSRYTLQELKILQANPNISLVDGKKGKAIKFEGDEIVDAEAAN